MRTRIMFIDCKTGNLNGFGRIGRVTFSKSGATLYYKGQSFRKVRCGYKHNCYDIETGERYWIMARRSEAVTGSTAHLAHLSMTMSA